MQPKARSRWCSILMKVALKKAPENWIKLAISQSGPAAALKQKGLVHLREHTGRDGARGCFFSYLQFSRELLSLLSRGEQKALQAVSGHVSSVTSLHPHGGRHLWTLRILRRRRRSLDEDEGAQRRPHSTVLLKMQIQRTYSAGGKQTTTAP